MASERIATAYAELRNANSSAKGSGGGGGGTLPITARTLETIIRLSTAHAKLKLSRMGRTKFSSSDSNAFLKGDNKNVSFKLQDKVVRLKLVRWVNLQRVIKSSSSSSSSNGLYTSKQYELNTKNVDLVLEDVRPYLIADGGNVDVVSVEDGIISLQLQGACGSCPSSTTTMKMGIERVLKEKFGDAVKDIRRKRRRRLRSRNLLKKVLKCWLKRWRI